MTFLYARLNKFFGNNSWCYYDPLNPLLLDQLNAARLRSEPLNIVLVGSAVRRFFEAWTWPNCDFKIWVLSGANKESLCQIYGIPAHHIGIIPRYQLFPHAVTLRPLQLEIPTDFVYGGRFATLKGTLHLIEFVSCLQYEFDLPIRLFLCGKFYEMQPHNHPSGKWSNQLFSKKVYSLIESLPWQYRPKFIFNRGPNNWILNQYNNPIYVSFSQHTHEDYGVSLAQAQSLGWPCILSSWGSHLDAKLENTWLAPKFDVFSADKKRKAECYKIADSLINYLNKKNTQKISRNDVPSSPRVVTKSDILKYLMHAEIKFSGITDSMMQISSNYYSTSSGKIFYRILERSLCSKNSFAKSQAGENS